MLAPAHASMMGVAFGKRDGAWKLASRGRWQHQDPTWLDKVMSGQPAPDAFLMVPIMAPSGVIELDSFNWHAGAGLAHLVYDAGHPSGAGYRDTKQFMPSSMRAVACTRRARNALTNIAERPEGHRKALQDRTSQRLSCSRWSTCSTARRQGSTGSETEPGNWMPSDKEETKARRVARRRSPMAKEESVGPEVELQNPGCRATREVKRSASEVWISPGIYPPPDDGALKLRAGDVFCRVWVELDGLGRVGRARDPSRPALLNERLAILRSCSTKVEPIEAPPSSSSAGEANSDGMTQDRRQGLCNVWCRGVVA